MLVVAREQPSLEFFSLTLVDEARSLARIERGRACRIRAVPVVLVATTAARGCGDDDRSAIIVVALNVLATTADVLASVLLVV